MPDFTSFALPKAAAHRPSFSAFAAGQDDSRSSSLQVLDEDYLPDESSTFGDRFDDILTTPKPVTTTSRPFPRSIALTPDEDAPIPRQPRVHQRSLTALLPSFRSPQRSPERSPRHTLQRSPTKEKPNSDFMPTLTGDRDGQIKIAEKSSGAFSGWFIGQSTPMSIGVPTETTSSNALSERASIQRRATAPALQLPANPSKYAGGRFGFFSKSKLQTVQIQSDLDDEFMNLDIRATLFPVGPPSESDPYSPSSFSNLLQNAETILVKLKTAYKTRTVALHELRAEREAEKEELEGTETRAQHLKIQLADMARRVAEQDESIARLTTELAREKRAREEECMAREQSIALVHNLRARTAHSISNDDDRDLFPRRTRSSRRSNDSMSALSDLASGTDSDEDSVFSRSMSPSLTSISDLSTSYTPSSRLSTLALGRAKLIDVRAPFASPKIDTDDLAKASVRRPDYVRRPSTFQKIMQGISRGPETGDSDVDDESDGHDEDVGSRDGARCGNCKGVSSSTAWDTVGVLRAENRGLKEKLEVMDKAMESALDVVAGLGL